MTSRLRPCVQPRPTAIRRASLDVATSGARPARSAASDRERSALDVGHHPDVGAFAQRGAQAVKASSSMTPAVAGLAPSAAEVGVAALRAPAPAASREESALQKAADAFVEGNGVPHDVIPHLADCAPNALRTLKRAPELFAAGARHPMLSEHLADALLAELPETLIGILQSVLLNVAFHGDLDAAGWSDVLRDLDLETPPPIEHVAAHIAELHVGSARARAHVDARLEDVDLPPRLRAIFVDILFARATSEQTEGLHVLFDAFGAKSREAFASALSQVEHNELLSDAGVSRLAIDMTRAALAEAPDVDDAFYRTLSDALGGEMHAVASLVRRLARQAPASPMRDAFEALRPPREGPRSNLDRLSAPLLHLPGFATLLPAAHAARLRARDAERPATPDAALTQKRPDLWVPLLFARPERTEAPLDDVAIDSALIDSALQVARQGVDAWRGKHLTKPTGSSIEQKREGTVCAVALATVLLDLERTRGGSAPSVRPQARLHELLDVVGQASFAKNGPPRTALLSALFQLAAHADRLEVDAPEWGRVDAALAERSPATITALCTALVDDIRRTRPSGDELAARVASTLGDARGAPGLARFVEGIAGHFASGVERRSLERLTTALEHGTLGEHRAASLMRARFPTARIDDGDLARVFAEFSRGASTTGAALLGPRALVDGRAAWQAIDSSDVLDWTRAVDDVESCQSTAGNPDFNRGLLNRFEDGAVRLIALRDASGATRTRAALRLVVVDDGRLALLLDRGYNWSYSTHDTAVNGDLLIEFARTRAREMGLSLVYPTTYATARRGQDHRVTFADPLATDYFDLGNGVAGPGEQRPIDCRLIVEG